VPLPGKEERKMMLKLFSKDILPESICDFISEKTDKYSGSDLKSFCKELIMNQIRGVSKQREIQKGDLKGILKGITEEQVENLLSRVKPSPCCDLKMYLQWAQRFGSI
jgi:SpoVK/Ycf46/Vps4 family AAA+-type ATPase